MSFIWGFVKKFAPALNWQLWGTVAAAAVAAAIGIYAQGRIQQEQHDKLRAQADLAKQIQKAREQEQTWQEQVKDIRDDYEIRTQVIAVERDDALQRLHDRPERLPEPARAACQGTTGAELSRPDAELLTRLAAEADALRAKLAEWEAWGDTVTNKR